MVQMFDYTAGAAPCDYKGGQRRHLKVCRQVRHLNQTRIDIEGSSRFGFRDKLLTYMGYQLISHMANSTIRMPNSYSSYGHRKKRGFSYFVLCRGQLSPIRNALRKNPGLSGLAAM